MIKPSVPDSLFVSTKEGCSGEALQSKVESPNAQNSFDSLHQPSEAALSSVHIQNKSTNSGDRKRLYSEISEESVEERKMFEDDDLLIKSLLGTLDPDDVFDEGEFVLAYFGDKIYHAQIKIRKLHDNRSEFTYFVHYPRWNSRWDEWMKADRLMKFTDENLKFMEQVNASKKNKKEKIQKHSNYERNSSTSKDINSDKKNSLGSNSELEKKSSKEIGDRVSLRSRRKLRRASDKLERRSVSKIRTRSHSEARNVLSSSSSSVNHPLNHPIEMESDMIKESENFPKIVPKPDKRESSNLSVTSLTNFCSPENFPFNKNTEMKIDGCAPYFEKMLDTPMKNSSKAGIDEVESKGIDYESKDDLQIISSRENEIKSHPDIFPIPLPKDKSDLLTSRHFFRKDETNGKIIGDSVNSNHSSRTLSEKNTSYLKLNPGVDEFLFREDIALPLSTLPPQPPFDLHLHLLTPLKIIDVHINKIDAEPSSVSKVILQLDIPDTLSDIALQNWESVTLNQKVF